MCGFLYAKLQNNRDEDFRKHFQAALRKMSYRGKDAIGYHEVGHHYFGHVRLAILDLSNRSNQPIILSRSVLLFKGEIYNYRDLENNAPSDTLAIAGHIEKGMEIHQGMSGMFAILIHHRELGITKLWRDFYGEKPLYYYHDRDIFIASSTIKAITYLLEHHFQKKLVVNKHALYDYFLCGFVREPKTIFEHVHALRPGHSLELTDVGLRIHNHHQAILANNQTEITEHAKLCMQTFDVKPSLLLSSGVDSTYLLSLMAQATEQFDVITYKSPHRHQDESQVAHENLKKILGKREVHHQLVKNHEAELELYEQYAELLEQPSSDGINLFNMLTMFRRVNATSKLVFLGTGGDELYGGYYSFKNLKKFYWMRRLSYLKNLLPVSLQRFFLLPQEKITIALYYFLYRSCTLFAAYLPKEIYRNQFAEFYHEMAHYIVQAQDALSQVKQCETFDYMRNQLLRDADNISLACGFEARNPLLSTKAYLLKPDFKQQIRTKLYQDYKISFARKKGFTFTQANITLNKTMLNFVREANEFYGLISKEHFAEIEQSHLFNFKMLTKIYNLFAWLRANQLQKWQVPQLAL